MRGMPVSAAYHVGSQRRAGEPIMNAIWAW